MVLANFDDWSQPQLQTAGLESGFHSPTEGFGGCCLMYFISFDIKCQLQWVLHGGCIQLVPHHPLSHLSNVTLIAYTHNSHLIMVLHWHFFLQLIQWHELCLIIIISLAIISTWIVVLTNMIAVSHRRTISTIINTTKICCVLLWDLTFRASPGFSQLGQTHLLLYMNKPSCVPVSSQ